jgi:hypothetical protein
MTGGLLLLIVVIAVAACLGWRHAKTRRRFGIKLDRFSSRYHSVSIGYYLYHYGNACEAVEKLEGKRFLSKEAPRLPLPGCGAEHCRCRYVHFKDRREDDRRTLHKSPLFVSADRRATTTRRQLHSDML